MSFNPRPFSPLFGGKKEVTVTATATAATLVVKAASGPIQMRIVNYDTVKVAYRFGDSSVAAVLTTDPTLAAGATEVVTVMPPIAPGSNNDIYFSVISDTSPAGNKFEATPGQGL